MHFIEAAHAPALQTHVGQFFSRYRYLKGCMYEEKFYNGLFHFLILCIIAIDFGLVQNA